MSASQVFILSKRGDIIFYRDFRHDIKKSNDIFFHNLNILIEEENIPPIFNIDGINFLHRKTDYIYFVISTLDNFSPNYYLELIDNLMIKIEDLIGDLTEESIRKNFILVNEIVDEMVDFGYPQLIDTEQVKEFVFTEPIVDIKKTKIQNIKEILNQNVKSQDQTRQSIKVIDDSQSKNEIFVDLIEKITCLFGKNGNILSSGIDGCIKMKSYLKKTPELKIVLSDDIIINNSNNYSNGKFELSGYNFCNGVRCKNFEKNKTLYLIPHEGEFILMNYRINSEFAPPFKIFTIIEESDYKLEFIIKLFANFSNKNHAGNIKISFNSPKNTQSVYFVLPEKFKQIQKVDYNQNKHLCIWTIPKITGSNEMTLNAKFTLQDNNPRKCRRELGPIAMSFEIPNYNISNMGIKELKIITNDLKYNPKKWVRTFTKAKSYVTRIA